LAGLRYGGPSIDAAQNWFGGSRRRG
jgi:hypothetical protein